MTFRVVCPFPTCDWESYEIDEFYWDMRYRIDVIKTYERHYQGDHYPIPLPHFIRSDES